MFTRHLITAKRGSHQANSAKEMAMRTLELLFSSGAERFFRWCISVHGNAHISEWCQSRTFFERNVHGAARRIGTRCSHKLGTE